LLENLKERLEIAFKSLRSKGRLESKDIESALREVRVALLEADVNFKAVKDLITKIKERAKGEKVRESLTPSQQVIKIVQEELTLLLGSDAAEIDLSPPFPVVIMLVGLQGTGKTTTAAKLAGHFQKEEKNILLVAADPYRPAASKQLETLAKQLGIDFFSSQLSEPKRMVREAVDYAQTNNINLVVLDTAGTRHIDSKMMEELREIKREVNPRETLLIADALTGQDAVNQALHFKEELGIDGIILTKLDGDARGGAALSMKAVTGQPIKFVGVGEKLNALERFYPQRMASQILGMGDVFSLIEKAEAALDKKKTSEKIKKIKRGDFDLEDFKEQLQQIRKMGPISQLLELVPGFSKIKRAQGLNIEDGELKGIAAIISSMTREERRNPRILNGSRKRRIAQGSGREVREVNLLLKNFLQMKEMMRFFDKKYSALSTK